MESVPTDPKSILVPPGIPIIELGKDDSLHELWTTEWTEFNLPQHGLNWRLVAMSVIHSGGILEFAIALEYENQEKVVLAHMRGDRFEWNNSIVPRAKEMAIVLTPEGVAPLELRLSSWDPIISEYDCGIRKTEGSQGD